MASKKNIAKSVRISDEVFAYIDAAPGKGFNEKFENIILEAKREEADRKERLADLEQRIHDAQINLNKLLDQDRELRQCFRQFAYIQHQVEIMKQSVERALQTGTEPDNKND